MYEVLITSIMLGSFQLAGLGSILEEDKKNPTGTCPEFIFFRKKEMRALANETVSETWDAYPFAMHFINQFFESCRKIDFLSFLLVQVSVLKFLVFAASGLHRLV